jgi:hypothetical protein
MRFSQGKEKKRKERKKDGGLKEIWADRSSFSLSLSSLVNKIEDKGKEIITVCVCG